MSSKWNIVPGVVSFKIITGYCKLYSLFFRILKSMLYDNTHPLIFCTHPTLQFIYQIILPYFDIKYIDE